MAHPSCVSVFIVNLLQFYSLTVYQSFKTYRRRSNLSSTTDLYNLVIGNRRSLNKWPFTSMDRYLLQIGSCIVFPTDYSNIIHSNLYHYRYVSRFKGAHQWAQSDDMQSSPARQIIVTFSAVNNELFLLMIMLHRYIVYLK